MYSYLIILLAVPQENIQKGVTITVKRMPSRKMAGVLHLGTLFILAMEL